MNGFPMSVDLHGKPVYLIGNGPQIRDKAEKLASFGPDLIFRETFTAEDALMNPAMVIVGDTPGPEAERISHLCHQNQIPVNVVDVPELCSFYFPALIRRGDLTVTITTGGTSPELAGCLRRRIEESLPENLDLMLQWLAQHRMELKQKHILKPVTAAMLEKGRLLTQEELELFDREVHPK